MRVRQSPPTPLPELWLLSDQRNDAVLEEALATLPKGSGFVFRHYHLDPTDRRKRFDDLGPVCRMAGHLMVLAGDSDTALAWEADGVYGPPTKLGKRAGLLRFATVHWAREIYLADRAGVDAMFLSPVYPTRSHPDGGCLGKTNFLELAARAKAPVIALGGMTAKRAAELCWPRWAAIDGLS
jgi:thiamine-phosphate pyrophosphorylase